MTAHERRTRYLRLLGDYQDRNRGSAPHLDELLGGELAEDGGPLWRETLQFLALDGLIRHYPSMAFSNDSAVLTDRGWQEVEELRRQAADPVLQRNVASNILLQWLYSKDAEGASEGSALIQERESQVS